MGKGVSGGGGGGEEEYMSALHGFWTSRYKQKLPTYAWYELPVFIYSSFNQRCELSTPQVYARRTKGSMGSCNLNLSAISRLAMPLDGRKYHQYLPW